MKKQTREGAVVIGLISWQDGENDLEVPFHRVAGRVAKPQGRLNDTAPSMGEMPINSHGRVDTVL